LDFPSKETISYTSSTSPNSHRLGVQKSFWGHRKFTGFSQEKQYIYDDERESSLEKSFRAQIRKKLVLLSL